MWEYLQRHEAFVRGHLADPAERDWRGLLEFHELQIARMQHERLIHLLVTLAVGLYFLVSVALMLAYPGLYVSLLALLLLALLVPYIVHYFRLENGVQRWYHLGNEIERRAGRVSACYETRPEWPAQPPK